MSTDAAHHVLRRQALRISFAVAAGLTWTTMAGDAIPGLAPVLALQMVLAPRTPGFKQGVGLVILVVAVTAVAHAMSIAFGDRPQVLALALTLFLSLGFLLQPRLPTPALLFLITVALVPVWIVQSPSGDMFLTIVEAVPKALIIVWVIDAVLPRRELSTVQVVPPRSAPAELGPRDALLKAVIVLPVQLYYIESPSALSLAAIVTLIIILNIPDHAQSVRVLIARLMGNVIGGLAAAAVFVLIYLQWSAVLLFLLALLAALVMSGTLVRGGARVPVLTLALVNFTNLLGVAVSQKLGGEPVDLASRLLDITVVAAYGLGASSLLRGHYRSGIGAVMPGSSVAGKSVQRR